MRPAARNSRPPEKAIPEKARPLTSSGSAEKARALPPSGPPSGSGSSGQQLFAEDEEDGVQATDPGQPPPSRMSRLSREEADLNVVANLFIGQGFEQMSGNELNVPADGNCFWHCLAAARDVSHYRR